jgi:hypothetical protein
MTDVIGDIYRIPKMLRKVGEALVSCPTSELFSKFASL